MKDNNQVVQNKTVAPAADSQPSIEGKATLSAPGYSISSGDGGDGPPIQKKENKTGLPDDLKGGIESLSGMDMSDVNVHYNSNKPAQVGALGYAQGSDIHLGSGQEKHLAHEAWHVVQQKQGRVNPTTSVNGTGVNDDTKLEKEADSMGAKATTQMKAASSNSVSQSNVSANSVQLKKEDNPIQMYPDPNAEGQFWELLRGNVVTTVDHVLEIDQMAINQFETDMDAQANPDASINGDLIDFAMDITQAAPHVKLAYKLLQNAYTRLSQTRSGSIELSSFSALQRAARQEVIHSIPSDWSQVSENSPAIFRSIAEVKNRETADNKSNIRSEAIQILSAVDNNKPDFRVIMRKLIQAWVGGAQDHAGDGWWELGDPVDGLQAGYLKVVIFLETNSRGEYLRHSFREIGIDDVDLPDGVKQSLTTAWGADYVLDELPFKGSIQIARGQQIVRFTKLNNNPTDELEGWSCDPILNARENTVEDLKEIYMRNIRPSVRHLS